MISLRDLARHIGASIVPPDSADLVLDGFAEPEAATATKVVLALRASYRSRAVKSAAQVVICRERVAGKITLVVDDPYGAFARATQLFYPQTEIKGQHIDSSCSIAANARVAGNIKIDYGVSVGDNCFLGDGVCIGANSVIAPDCMIGAGTVIHPCVTVLHSCVIGKHCRVGSGSVIGGDGFGYAAGEGRWHRIHQTGRVVIGDYCDLGSNCCVDRGTISDTMIGSNTVVDNFVQIGHNVAIGEGSAISGMVAIGGSAVVGRRCRIWGQCGINSHIRIADDVYIMGKSAVVRSLLVPGTYGGTPAVEIKKWRRNIVLLKKIDALHDRVRRLEAQVKS